MEKDDSALMALFFLPSGINKLTVGLFVFGLIVMCGHIIHGLGGTFNPYLHCFYLPIIIAGTSLGIVGGTMAGLLSAFILGPFMPAQSYPHIEQHLNGWMFRGLMFTIVGFFAGGSAHLYQHFNKRQRWHSLTDPLTNLLNLRGLTLSCDDVVTTLHARKNTASSALIHAVHPAIIIMEVHHIQEIEQAFGSEAVQTLLYDIAIKLQEVVPQSLAIAHLHLGGFIIVTENLTMANKVVDDCQHHIPNSFTVNEIPLLVEMCFGIAEWADEDMTVSAVVRKAKIAVVKAKRTRHCAVIYESVDDERLEQSMYIIHDFDQALKNDELTLYYQPQLDLKTGKINGVEALMRWRHKKLGMISPDIFIPIIEKTLLINPLTEWVIEKSIAQLAAWHAKDMRISLSINFSTMNFEDDHLLQVLFHHVSKHEIPPHFIEVEITETAVAYNIDRISSVLTLLGTQGFRIAIDDFGTGQSSLKYLCELPVDTLKIDKFFIMTAMTNRNSQAIVRSAIFLARELNLTIIAEGIDTLETQQWLAAQDCHCGQGYFIAKPLESASVYDWIQQQNKF